MKKTYITPALVAVKIESAQMLAGSLDKSEEGTDNQWSNKYEGPAGGFLWEDDTNAGE